MNDDELLVTRLREMVGHVPPVQVDRDDVLRRGRRRRVLRASGATVGAGVLCAGLYLAVGGSGSEPASTFAPASGDESSSPTTSPAGPVGDGLATEGARAVIDESAGTITLPLDAWLPSRQERAVTRSARDVYLARCTTAAGRGDIVDLVGPVRVPSGTGNEQSYGAWRVETLEQWGYEQPGLDDALPNRIGAADAAATELVSSCQQSGIDEGLAVAPGQLDVLALEGVEAPVAFTGTAAGRVVLAEWRGCLADRGVEPPAEGGGMVPPAAVDASLDEQVRIGRIDIACKDELDVVQRLADVDAAEQREYIVRAGDRLEQRRAIEQAVLSKAEAYLASQGLSMGDASW